MLRLLIMILMTIKPLVPQSWIHEDKRRKGKEREFFLKVRKGEVADRAGLNCIHNTTEVY